MTIATKHTLSVKKIPLIKEKKREKEVIEITPDTFGWEESRNVSLTMLCLTATVAVVVVTIITAGFIVQWLQLGTPTGYRIHGFCAIPIGPMKTQKELITTSMPFQMMPIRWVSSIAVDSEDFVPILATLDGRNTEHFGDSLREELDIAEGVEKIIVIENGHRVSFIHDFVANATGIVDASRCFTLELDPDMTMAPVTLVNGLTRGDPFDVMPVRSSLRASLPAVSVGRVTLKNPGDPMPRELIESCSGKPIYLLRKATDTIVRKRSVDEVPHDYIQFAGKHVQEIEINNLADILEYEQNTKINDTKNNTA